MTFQGFNAITKIYFVKALNVFTGFTAKMFIYQIKDHTLKKIQPDFYVSKTEKDLKTCLNINSQRAFTPKQERISLPRNK